MDDVQGGFRLGRRCAVKIFTQQHIGEKAREKKCRVYMSFVDLEKS